MGLEITRKSCLFQTQLVVGKCILILSYGLLVSQELSVPVVMITREMHNGMSKQFNTHLYNNNISSGHVA